MAQKKWDIEKIKAGFDKFLKENGRLPIAPEIDRLSYLPSSRQIQRRFGGLKELRKTLGYPDFDFGSGESRKKIAKRTYKQGFDAEKLVEQFLVSKFGEVFVHVEKRFVENKNRVDFFVYNPSLNFAVEVIQPGSFRDLQKNVNLKIDRYRKFPYILIFLVANDNYSQKRVDNWINNKRKALPENSKVWTLEVFKKWASRLKSYPDPTVKHRKN